MLADVSSDIFTAQKLRLTDMKWFESSAPSFCYVLPPPHLCLQSPDLQARLTSPRFTSASVLTLTWSPELPLEPSFISQHPASVQRNFPGCRANPPELPDCIFFSTEQRASALTRLKKHCLPLDSFNSRASDDQKTSTKDDRERVFTKCEHAGSSSVFCCRFVHPLHAHTNTTR